MKETTRTFAASVGALWLLATALEATAAELFHADFDNGLGTPVKAERIQLVPGVKGQGAMVPIDGVLDYPAAGNISADKGTISLWVKLNWTPVGSGTFADRPVPGEPGWKKWIHTLFSASPALNPFTLSLEPAGHFTNKVLAGDWRHFAMTWDSRKQERKHYLDGLPTNSGKYLAAPLSKTLGVGSATGAQLGMDGTVDEVKVFDRALADSEILQLHAEVFPVAVAMLDHAGVAGKAGEYFRVRFVNTTGDDVKKDFNATIVDSAGKTLKECSFAIAVKANETVLERLEFTPPAPGEYQIQFSVDGLRQRTSVITAIAPESVTAAMPSSSTGEVKMKLLEEIDCAQDYPESKYRDDGSCHVVKSPAGNYRETTLLRPGSGFAYRLEVKNQGKPHWLEIEYPDDADRIFSFVAYPRCDRPYPRVYTGGNLDNIGVLTGGFHPLTNQMQTKRLLLWPDTPELLVALWSFPGDGRAAASKIRLYENDGPLPKLELNYPDGLPPRTIDIWNEDPSMEASNWFNRPECYPASDFAFWKTKAERMVEYFRFVGRNSWSFELFAYGGDNSGTLNYALPADEMWGLTSRVPGYADLLATVFDREGIPFYIELNHRVTKDKALGLVIGADAFSANFEEAQAKGDDAIEEFTGQDTLARGLNPLHPKVQAAYLKIFRLYREKFGRYQQFQGINNISPWQVAFDDGGYSDYTVHLFEKETGVAVPGDGPARFSKRHAWLKANAWDKWISWRCGKIRDFYVRLLRELDGKKLVTRVETHPKDNAVMNELAAGKASSSLNDAYRERGIDLALLSQVEGLIVTPTLEPNMEIHGHDTERYYAFSPEFAALFKDDKFPAVLVQQHANLERWDSQNQRIKSFWWPLGICVYNDNKAAHYSTPQPDNRYVLENMAWVLAELDPQFIEHGWWGCPENGDYADYQKFYQAYLSIPQLPFAKAPGTNDPVTLRVHNSDKAHWFYLVNKACYPVKVSFSLNGAPFARELKGFEVLVRKCPEPVVISGFVQEIPAAEQERLAAILSEGERKLALYQKIYGSPHPAGQAIVAAANEFFAKGEYTQAERRLESNALREMAKELSGGLQRSLSADGDLTLRFTNTEAVPVSGKLSLTSWPKNWTPERDSFEFKDLAPGTTFVGTFRFATIHHLGGQLDFQAKLVLAGKPDSVSTFAFHPFLALKAAKPIMVDADLSDWDKDAVWYKLSPLGEDKPAKPCSATYAWRWEKKGLALAVKVDEADFLAPDQEGSMYLRDSLQVYFDQLDNKSQAYDGNDLVYQVGLVKGSPMAWRELAPDGQKLGVADNVQVAVKRQGGSTFYEVYFPAAEFTRTKLESGATLGFSVMVNNSDNAGPGRELHYQLNVNPYASPYLNPWSWRDLLLADAPPTELRATAEGSMPLEGLAGGFERPHWLKDKPEQSARTLLFGSKNLSPEWRKVTFEFVPAADGQVTLSLGGQWTPDGNRLPAYWIRNVQVSGAKAAKLDNWQHYDIPETRRENGVLEVKIDMHHPYFTRFQAKKGVPVKVTLEAKNTNPPRNPDDLALLGFFKGLYELPQDSPARFSLNKIADRGAWRAMNLLRGDWPGSDTDRAEARQTLEKLKTEIELGLKWPFPRPPAYDIPRAPAAPVLDGKLDDPAWDKALTLHGEYPLASPAKTADGAIWKMMWDKDNLYVGAFLPDQTPRNCEPVYDGDSMEIFVMPSKRLKDYWEVVVGRDNVVFDGLHVNNKWGTFVNGPEHDIAGLKTKAAEAEGGYTVEVAIPFSELPNHMLGNPPQPGETINFALLRTDKDASDAPAAFHTAFPLLQGGHNVFGHATGTLR